MTRFEEVARLRELEKKVGYDRVEHGAPFRAFMARSAPWLLEAAACFQPGDARALEFFIENLPVIRKNDENSWMSYADYNELDNVIRRLQKAAEIMEGLE